MKYPYMPLFVSDYEGDTAHLSILEDGVYMRMLRLCWRTPGGTLPDDKDWLIRRLRITEIEYEQIAKTVIDEFFKKCKGRLINPRLKAELQKVIITSEARAKAGAKGGKAGKSLKTLNKESSPAQANAKQTPSKKEANDKHPYPYPYPYPKPIKGDNSHELSIRGTNDFEIFWEAYPKRVAKTVAIKAWKKAIKLKPPADIITCTHNFALTVADKDPQFTPHPATWLNQMRWDDPPENAPNGVLPVTQKIQWGDGRMARKQILNGMKKAEETPDEIDN